MRSDIKVGDEVLTIGGFYGVIYAIDDQNVVLEMLPDFTKAMVVKSAISKVITEADKTEEKAAPEDDATTVEEIEEVEVEPADNDSEAADDTEAEDN